jgi:hypothetical protein
MTPTPANEILAEIRRRSASLKGTSTVGNIPFRPAETHAITTDGTERCVDTPWAAYARAMSIVGK